MDYPGASKTLKALLGQVVGLQPLRLPVFREDLERRISPCTLAYMGLSGVLEPLLPRLYDGDNIFRHTGSGYLLPGSTCDWQRDASQIDHAASATPWSPQHRCYLLDKVLRLQPHVQNSPEGSLGSKAG
jgi:hypothetical protein